MLHLKFLDINWKISKLMFSVFIRFVGDDLCPEIDLETQMNRLFLVYFVVLCAGCSYGMTRAQVKKTMGIIKNQCMPKNSVTEDQVGRIEQGVFIEDRNVMCYVACIYKSLQVVKNDKLDMALISKQIDILYPQELKEPVKKSVAACIHSQDNYSDLCEGVFYASKCLYEKDPASFIFP